MASNLFAREELREYRKREHEHAKFNALFRLPFAPDTRKIVTVLRTNKNGVTMNAADVRVGKRIRARRLELGISQMTLGRHLNISFQQIQKYESGGNRVSAGRLKEIAVFFKVDLDYFFDQRQIEDDATLRDVDSILATKEGMDLLRAIVRIEDRAIRAGVVRLIRSIAISGRYDSK